MAKVIYSEEMERFIFECPGCGCLHFFDKSWKFNNDFEKPTAKPSLLVFPSKPEKRCHSFVTGGKIQFLDDCFHDLKNQTVEIPDFDESKTIYDYD